MKTRFQKTVNRRSFTFKSVLTAALALMWAVNAQAQVEIIDSGSLNDNINWTFTSDNVITITGIGDMPNSTSPWYKHYEKITAVVIGEGITAVGNQAFSYIYGYPKITSVTLPSTLKVIGSDAFLACTGITEITIPDGVETIKQGAFYGKYTTINIPASVTSLALQTSTSTYAFDGHNKLLTEFVVDANNPNYSSVDGILYNKTQDILLQIPNGKVTAANIPATVKIIRQYAGFGKGGGLLSSIILPDGLGTIEESAFYMNTSLQSITLPASVQTVGNLAFGSCSKMATINLASVGEIGEGAFSGTGVTSLTVPNTVTSLGVRAFASNTKLTTVVMNNSGAIPIQCFSGCGLTSVTLGNGITRIEQSAFTNCRVLPEITIPNTVQYIGREAFYNCVAMDIVRIGSGVINMGAAPFRTLNNPSGWSMMTKLEVDAANPVYSSRDGILYNKEQTELLICPEGKVGAVDIPATVTHIKDEAFYNCAKMTSVSIPTSVTHIGTYVFYACKSLGGVLTIPSHIVSIGDYAFQNCTGFTGNITLPATLEAIGYRAFQACHGLTGVTMNSQPTANIGNEVFGTCEGLTYAIIGEGVKKLPNNTFWRCNNLASVQLPATLESIGNNAFTQCYELSSISLPESLKTIGAGAFASCNKMTSGVVIPASVTTLGGNAFSMCDKIPFVQINMSDLGVIEYQAFDHCDSLKTVIIGDGVRKINHSAFKNCGKLISVTIGENVTDIGYSVFSGCVSLRSIVSKSETPPECNIQYQGNPNGYYIFHNVPTDAHVIVPCSAAEAYQAANGWKTFSNISCNPVGNTVSINTGSAVGEDATDEIGINFDLPTNVAFTGSFELSLPAGITLDEENTILSPELAESLTLQITAQPNNVWIIGIVESAQQLRAGSALRAGSIYQNILTLAYTVDESVTDGTYTAYIKNLSFEFTDGATISETNVPAEISVQRGGITTVTGAVKQDGGRLYPNPVKDELNIAIGDDSQLQINRIAIVDLSGKTIQQIDGLQRQINVSALTKGIYFLRVETDKGIVAEKFVKE